MNDEEKKNLPRPRPLPTETPKTLNARQRLIAFLSAHGISDKEISKYVRSPSNHISALIKSSMMQEYIMKLQDKIFIDEPRKRFEKIFPKAVQTAEEIMVDPDEKGAVRLNAAINFMDRVAGKPKQEVEVGGSIIRDLYEKLDKQTKVIDTTGEVVDAEFSEEPDELDKLADDLFKEG